MYNYSDFLVAITWGTFTVEYKVWPIVGFPLGSDTPFKNIELTCEKKIREEQILEKVKLPTFIYCPL